MKKIFSLALFLGLALGLNFAVSAQDTASQPVTPKAQEKSGRKEKTGKRGDRKGKASRGMGGFGQLNLTDAQKQQIRNIRQSNQGNDAARAEMRQLMQAKRDGGGSLTAEQTARLQTLKQQAKADRERQQQQILSVLTPEQRQQWEQNKANGKGRRQNKQTRNSPQDY